MKENRAERFNNGKLQWGLVDFPSLEDMVRVLEFGAKKYAPNNWKKGFPTVELSESLMRHLFAYLGGEDNDPESGLPHVGHIMCNAMFLSYMMRNKPEFDNRNRENEDSLINKNELIELFVKEKVENNNQVDLDAYYSGLSNMFDYLTANKKV